MQYGLCARVYIAIYAYIQGIYAYIEPLKHMYNIYIWVIYIYIYFPCLFVCFYALYMLHICKCMQINANACSIAYQYSPQ